MAFNGLLVSTVLLPFVLPSFDEYRLLQYLKENYDHFERPVENSSMPLDVKVRFLLNQILDVDEKNQVMSILAYIDFHWNDYKLRWDPKMFGGVRDVRFAGEQDAPFKLWKPDVLLFNSVSEAFDSTYSSRFIVNYDGHVQQNPPGIFRFICKVDVTYYPFDTQTCFLKLGSWTYSGRYINLDFMLTTMIGVKGHLVQASSRPYGDNPDSYTVNESIDLQVYLQNGEWDLMNTPGTRVVTVFGEESYHELYYYIHIRRRTLAYGINLIIPSLVISMMTVLGFTLPPDACEKITLETTVLLSVIFFLQMVSNMSPPQSKSVPILAAFFSCCLMVVACSCVFTVLTICLHERKAETHEMSPLMRRVFVEWLPYILMMRTPDHPRAPKPKVIAKSILPIHRLSTLPLLNLPRPSTLNTAIQRSSSKTFENRPSYLMYFDQFCDELEVVSSNLEKMATTLKDIYAHEIITSEWRFAAMAVDRLCLYLFSIFIAVSTCGIIMPHIIM
ncbi:Cation transporter family protein [Teladorsagia circumcincta]|uniref:Cation transporter family protein n=1 Tax=Teladorsagia circumcincta TaxID=45464 RepID=A0A2G9URY5_TELCI|nr:Cation transporter family protein [Teladorsagia circumcincta]